MIELATPWALLLVLPVLALVIQPSVTGRNRLAVASLEAVEAGWSVRLLLAWLPSALQLIGLMLCVVALARPRETQRDVVVESEGLDILLAVDTSGSMQATDFQVGGRPMDRLSVAKGVMAEFVEGRPHDRIGVVAYEGEAFTQIPLTTDQRVVMNGIGELQTGLLEGGTAIGMGLATAVNRLKDSEAESKVVILLTDGVNNAGKIEPLDAAQLAKLNDIRVYTIGVGTIGKARSPVAKVGNQFQYDWVEVEIDETVLRGIAKLTGGRYFRATNGEKLASIYTEIDELEKTRFNVLRYNQKTEEFLPFGIAAVLAFFIEFLLRQFAIRTLI